MTPALSESSNAHAMCATIQALLSLFVWRYTTAIPRGYYDGVALEDLPVLLTNSLLNPRSNRERMIRIVSETFEVQTAMSLFAPSW